MELVNEDHSIYHRVTPAVTAAAAKECQGHFRIIPKLISLPINFLKFLDSGLPRWYLMLPQFANMKSQHR